MKLSSKLILMMSMIAVITGMVIGVVVVRSTNSSFGEYLQDTQQVEIGQWEDLYCRYYINNGYSWSGVQTLMDSYVSTAKSYTITGDGSYAQPIVLVATDRRILAHPTSALVGQRISVTTFEHGFPIYDDRKDLIGYLFPLDYFDQRLWNLEDTFIKSIQSAVIKGILVAFCFAVIVGIFFTHSTVMPLRRMITSIRRIGEGSTNEKVPVTTDDEIGELGLAFNQMSEELARSNDARVQLFADISHELRTPLTVIAGKLENTLNRNQSCSVEEISSLYDEVLRLNSMVNELQNISRLDAGHMALNKTEIDFKTFFSDFFLLVNADAEARSIKLKVDIPDDLPPCWADPERLKQIVLNLVSNALRYTQDGGTVVQKAWSENKRFYFSVTDTGIGMTEEECQHVFDRFYRTDRSRARETGGTGLGMAITKGLVEAHGGEISVKSIKNVETTFTLWLPLRENK
jgi:two-component system sensor histidine kinase BaeS